MKYEKTSIERRHHTRVHARGSVILRAAGQQAHGRAIVVSDTALEVSCQLGAALPALAGASVEIEMRLDGETGGWFILHGQVARVRPEKNSLVIAIAALPEPISALLARHAHDPAVRAVEVMIVDSELARRTRVAQAFRAEGCHVLEVSTALDAIDSLERGDNATDLIAVADTIPETAGTELRDYLEQAHADSFVIAVGDPEWLPGRTRLDPSDADGQLSAHVRSVLLAQANS